MLVRLLCSTALPVYRPLPTQTAGALNTTQPPISGHCDPSPMFLNETWHIFPDGRTTPLLAWCLWWVLSGSYRNLQGQHVIAEKAIPERRRSRRFFSRDCFPKQAAPGFLSQKICGVDYTNTQGFPPVAGVVVCCDENAGGRMCTSTHQTHPPLFRALSSHRFWTFVFMKKRSPNRAFTFCRATLESR
jgi:hypothetical protein